MSSIEDDFTSPCVNNSQAGVVMSPAPSTKYYNCFQFQHQPPPPQSDGGSSRSSSVATSQPPLLQTSQPKFYKEIPIGSDDHVSFHSIKSFEQF